MSLSAIPLKNDGFFSCRQVNIAATLPYIAIFGVGFSVSLEVMP